MAMSFGDTVAHEILSLYVSGTLPTAPAGCFLHYYTSSQPADDGSGGTPLPADGWYAPVDVRAAFGAAPASREIANTVAITVGTPLVARGPIRFAALRESAVASSKLIVKNQLATFITTVVGVPFIIPIGQLSFKIN